MVSFSHSNWIPNKPCVVILAMPQRQRERKQAGRNTSWWGNSDQIQLDRSQPMALGPEHGTWSVLHLHTSGCCDWVNNNNKERPIHPSNLMSYRLMCRTRKNSYHWSDSGLVIQTTYTLLDWKMSKFSFQNASLSVACMPYVCKCCLLQYVQGNPTALESSYFIWCCCCVYKKQKKNNDLMAEYDL